MNKQIKDIIKNILMDIDANSIPDGQSYFLRYEFFNMLYYLDHKKVKYDDKRMYRLLNKLDYLVCKKFGCPSYVR